MSVGYDISGRYHSLIRVAAICAVAYFGQMHHCHIHKELLMGLKCTHIWKIFHKSGHEQMKSERFKPPAQVHHRHLFAVVSVGLVGESTLDTWPNLHTLAVESIIAEKFQYQKFLERAEKRQVLN